MSRIERNYLKEERDRIIMKMQTVEADSDEYKALSDRLKENRKMIEDENQNTVNCLMAIISGTSAAALGYLYYKSQVKLAYDAFDFERGDSIASSTGRTVIGNMLKNFKIKF